MCGLYLTQEKIFVAYKICKIIFEFKNSKYNNYNKSKENYYLYFYS